MRALAAEERLEKLFHKCPGQLLFFADLRPAPAFGTRRRVDELDKLRAFFSTATSRRTSLAL
jgi:hypothetical protein